MSVFVSGATGYIAQHIIAQLLEENYKVIGSVRTQAKADRLARLFNNPNLSFVIVPDLAKLDAFDEAFREHGKEIKYVLHTASPCFFESDDVVNEILIPARNGTVSILESIKKHAADTVERVVITSSYAATGDITKLRENKEPLTEDCWNDLTWENCQKSASTAYCCSKKTAEKAAWDFLRENKDKVKFKLTTVNPVYVFGPQLFDASVSKVLNLSCEILNCLLQLGPNDKFDEFYGHFIDVRDVAKVHLLAFQREDTAGHRLLLSEGDFDSQDLLNQVNADFPSVRGKIPVGNPEEGVRGKKVIQQVDNTKTKKLLGMEFISFEKSIDDTARQIFKADGRL